MIIAVDVGGTKTLVADFDKEGKMHTVQRFETPHDEAEFITHLSGLIRRTYPDQSLLAGLSIALPGVFNDEGDLELAPNLGWRHIAIKSQLESFMECPVFVENDANLAGLAEARSIEPIPASCLYLTISTGIGSGVIINGNIIPELSASEAGHMRLTHNGKVAEWESFASGRAIKKEYGQYARDIISNASWREIADTIALGLNALIPTLQPDVIVIGGSIGTYFDRYEAALQAVLSLSFKESVISLPIIKQAAHPEEAVIYGCYYHALDHLNLSTR